MIKTKPFGRIAEPYTAADDYFAEQPVRCSACGEVIPEGDMAWYIKGEYYCAHCDLMAMDAVFAIHSDDYVVEVDH